jgi:HEAT repeat protein
LGSTSPDPETTRGLADAARDADQELRMAIAGSLLKLNGPDDPEAAALLCGLVTDPEPAADRSAVSRLLQLASEQSRRRVIAALAEFLKRADPLILPEVIGYLSEVSPQADLAVPALTELLDHPDSAVRAAAASTVAALEEKPGPRVLKALVRMVTDTDLTNEQRLGAMGRLQEVAPAMLSEATSELVRQLGDPNVVARRSALELLVPILEAHPAALPDGGPGK